MKVIVFAFFLASLCLRVHLIIISNIIIKSKFKIGFNSFRELLSGFPNINGVQLAQNFKNSL